MSQSSYFCGSQKGNNGHAVVNNTSFGSETGRNHPSFLGEGVSRIEKRIQARAGDRDRGEFPPEFPSLSRTTPLVAMKTTPERKPRSN